MASHAERQPHLGSSLPNLPAFQSFPQHHHSGWRISPTTCPFPSHSHRRSRSFSLHGRISILHQRCRPLNALGGSLYYPGHHSKDYHVPALWLDCTLWLSSNHNHQPRTPVRIPAFSQPCENVWYSPQKDDPSPPRSQRPRRATILHTEGRHHVPYGQAVDRGLATRPPRNSHRLQGGSTVIRIRARLWRTPTDSWRVPGSSYNEGRTIHLHLAAPPPHELTAPHIGSTPRIPGHIHPQNPPEFEPGLLAAVTIRGSLEPPYSGPNLVRVHSDKALQIVVRGRHVNFLADRVKPAYLLGASQHDTNNPPALPNSTPSSPDKTPTLPTKTTRSGRTIRHPVCFTT